MPEQKSDEQILEEVLLEEDLVTSEKFEECETIRENLQDLDVTISVVDLLRKDDLLQEEDLKQLQEQLNQHHPEREQLIDEVTTHTEDVLPESTGTDLVSSCKEEGLISEEDGQQIRQLRTRLDEEGFPFSEAELLIRNDLVSREQIKQLSQTEDRTEQPAGEEIQEELPEESAADPDEDQQQQKPSSGEQKQESEGETEAGSAELSPEEPEELEEDSADSAEPQEKTEDEHEEVSPDDSEKQEEPDEAKKRFLHHKETAISEKIAGNREPVLEALLEELVNREVIEADQKQQALEIYRDLQSRFEAHPGEIAVKNDLITYRQYEQSLDALEELEEHGIAVEPGILIEHQHDINPKSIGIVQKIQWERLEEEHNLSAEILSELPPNEYLPPYLSEQLFLARMMEEGIFDGDDLDKALEEYTRQRRIREEAGNLNQIQERIGEIAADQLEEVRTLQEKLTASGLDKAAGEILLEKGLIAQQDLIEPHSTGETEPEAEPKEPGQPDQDDEEEAETVRKSTPADSTTTSSGTEQAPAALQNIGERILEKILLRNDIVEEDHFEECKQLKNEISAVEVPISIVDLLLKNDYIDRDQLKRVQELLEENYQDKEHLLNLVSKVYSERHDYSFLTEPNLADRCLDQVLISRKEYQQVQQQQSELSERGVQLTTGELLVKNELVSPEQLRMVIEGEEQQTEASVQENLPETETTEEEGEEEPEEAKKKYLHQKEKAISEKMESIREPVYRTLLEELVERGIIESDQKETIGEIYREVQTGSEHLLGKIAVENGFITYDQLQKTLDTLKEVEGMGIEVRIGEVMVENGYIDREALQSLLNLQRARRRNDPAESEQQETEGAEESEVAPYSTERLLLDRLIEEGILSETDVPEVLDVYFQQRARRASVKKIGQIAVNNDLLTEEQLQEALDVQNQLGEWGFYKPIGEILVEKEFISQSTLGDLLELQKEEGRPNEPTGESPPKGPEKMKKEIDFMDRAGLAELDEEAGAETRPEAEQQQEEGLVFEDRQDQIISTKDRETPVGFRVLTVLLSIGFLTGLGLFIREVLKQQQSVESTEIKTVQTSEETRAPAHDRWSSPETNLPDKRNKQSFLGKTAAEAYGPALPVFLLLKKNPNYALYRFSPQTRRRMLRNAVEQSWLNHHGEALLHSFIDTSFPSPGSPTGTPDLGPEVLSEIVRSSRTDPYTKQLALNQIDQWLSSVVDRNAPAEILNPGFFPEYVLAHTPSLRRVFRNLLRALDSEGSLPSEKIQNILSRVVLQNKNGTPEGSLWCTLLLNDLLRSGNWETIINDVSSLQKALNTVKSNALSRYDLDRDLLDQILNLNAQQEGSRASALVDKLKESIRANEERRVRQIVHGMSLPGWNASNQEEPYKKFRSALDSLFDQVKEQGIFQKRTYLNALLRFTIVHNDREQYRKYRIAAVQEQGSAVGTNEKDWLLRQFGDPVFLPSKKEKQRMMFGTSEGSTILFRFPDRSLNLSGTILNQYLRNPEVHDHPEQLKASIRAQLLYGNDNVFKLLLKVARQAAKDDKEEIVREALQVLPRLGVQKKLTEKRIQTIMENRWNHPQFRDALRTTILIQEARKPGTFGRVWNRLSDSNTKLLPKSVKIPFLKELFNGYLQSFPSRAEPFMNTHLKRFAELDEDWTRETIFNHGLYSVAGNVLQYYRTLRDEKFQEGPKSGHGHQRIEAFQSQLEELSKKPYGLWHESVKHALFEYRYKSALSRLNENYPDLEHAEERALRLTNESSWLQSPEEWNKWFQWSINRLAYTEQNPSFILRYLLHPVGARKLFGTANQSSDDRSVPSSLMKLLRKDRNTVRFLLQSIRSQDGLPVRVKQLKNGSRVTVKPGKNTPILDLPVRGNTSVRIQQDVRWKLTWNEHSIALQGDLIRVPEHDLTPVSSWKFVNVTIE